MPGNELSWDEGGWLCLDDISLFEQKFSVILPGDFKAVVMHNDGAAPGLPCIDFSGEREKVFSGLIHLVAQDDGNSSIVELIENNEQKLPRGIIPFGEDPFGNLYCFDYRSNDIPVIVYWDHDLEMNEAGQFIFVAKNFTGFLNSLYLPEDD